MAEHSSAHGGHARLRDGVGGGDQGTHARATSAAEGRRPRRGMGLEHAVDLREQRMLRARRRGRRSSWFGLGMYGLIGWSVAIPTLLGVAIGVWADERWPSGLSWTLMLLVGGLLLGCANAWYWLTREQRAIAEEREEERGAKGVGDG
jgi:ATP synthase protein I